MKTNYKGLWVLGACLFASAIGFSQESPLKPIKQIQVLNQDQQKALGSEQQLFNEQLKNIDGNTFSFVSERPDSEGFIHRTYTQSFQGIPVAFSKAVVHAKEGKIQSVTNNIFRISDLSTTPVISANQALTAAKNKVGATTYLWEKEAEAAMLDGYTQPTGDLVVFPAVEGISDENRLAYKFDIYASEPLYRADVYVDATSGQVIFENLKIHHADTPATGSSLYNGTVNITADSFNGSYRLRQAADGGGIQTYDLNNGTSYNNASDVTSADTSFPGATATGVQAHYGAEQTHRYFLQKHNRNSYNGNGAIIRSYVSYSSNYVNAFWDGSRMTYGDGDGVNYGPLVSLDIVGHEIGHGVTDFTADLVYSYQSGALNESFSDIFGEAIENFATGSNDWLMGDQIGAGGSGGALRNMANPNQFGDPDTYLGTNWWTSSGDNGGVHINSGVQNFWFYLLSTGGSGTNDVGDVYNVTALGMETAAAIAYRNLSVYLSVNSQYADARAGAIQAAIDLYGAGSQEEISVTNAWYAVNVGDAYDSTPPPPPTCYEGDVSLSITLDNYPEETAWTLKNSAGTTVASNSYSAANPDGSTVTATFASLASGDYTFTITDAYGDGICCSYGQGSYTLTAADGTVIKTGGAFGSSETTTFCMEDGGGGPDPDTQAPTEPGNLTAINIAQTTATLDWNASSDDTGVTGYEVFEAGTSIGTVTGTSADITGLTANTTYTFSVEAFDAAGNNSSAASTTFTTLDNTGGGDPVIVHEGYFETGWDGWQDGGSDSFRYAGTRSYEGSYSIRLRDNTNSSTMTLSNVDVSGFNNVEVDFYFFPNSMENGEDFWLQYNSGSGWQTVASYARGTSFNNDTFYNATVTLNSADYNFPSNAQFRFRCDASGNGDRIYIDQVTITGDAAPSLRGDGLIALGSPQGLGDFEDDGPEFDGDLRLFPNPAKNLLNVQMVDVNENTTYRILNMLGQLVKEGSLVQTLDVSNLQSGMYIIEVNDGEDVVSEKFIKQ